MNTRHKIPHWFYSIVICLILSACGKENPDYIFTHDDNLIHQMIGKAAHGSSEFMGQITEFDQDDQVMEGDFSQPDVEGGYGLILFPIPKSLENDVDLTRMYLKATVTYDEMITPSLSGRQDISGEGMIITVTSGEGTTRQYRVRGFYE